MQQTLPQLDGAYALAVVWARCPDALVVARRQAPLLIGFGEGEFLCASDTPALAGVTRTILPLEDGEVALGPLGIELYNEARAAAASGGFAGTGHGGQAQLPSLHAQGDLERPEHSPVVAAPFAGGRPQ